MGWFGPQSGDCTCCETGPTCDDLADCECIQDGEIANFPPFQFRFTGFRLFNDIDGTGTCTACDDSGLNGTWFQYDFCVDGTTTDQPTAGALGGQLWYKIYDYTNTFDCLGFEWSFKIFVRVYRFDPTTFYVEVVVEDYDSATRYKWSRATITVTDCNCPNTGFAPLFEGVGTGGGQMVCEYNGELEFQWL